MNSIQSFAALIAGSGLLITLLSVPLILHRVPPNSIYGIRTKASFASDSEWYRINEIGGRYLTLSGIIILAVGIVGFFLPDSSRNSYFLSATAITFLAVIVPCIRLCLIKRGASPNDKGHNA